MKAPLIRFETMSALYKALDAKKINGTELNACSRFFDERDYYDKNPSAKMLPGFMERESMVSDILAKALA